MTWAIVLHSHAAIVPSLLSLLTPKQREINQTRSQHVYNHLCNPGADST